MKKNKKLVIGIGIVALLGIVSVGVYNNPQQAINGKVIRIGAILPLSGPVASDGEEALIGMQIALDALRARDDGCQYSLDVKDGKFEAMPSLNAYKLLVSEKADVIMSVGDVPCQMIQPLLEKDRKPAMAPMAASLQSINQSAWMFRSWTSIEQIGKLMGRYLRKQGNAKTAAVFYIDTMYGVESYNAFSSEFMKEGCDVVAKDSFPYLASDLRTSITKIIKHNPDVVYITGFGPTYIVAINQFRELGYSGLIALDAAVVDPRVKKNIKNFRSLIFAGIAWDDELIGNEASKEFAKAYESKTGRNAKDIPPQAPFSYFAVMTMVDAFMASGSFEETVSKLGAMRDVPSLIGRFSYNSEGELYVPIYIKKFDDAGNSISIDKMLWKEF